MRITISYTTGGGPASQTITVGTPAPASAEYGSNFSVAATASSGLSVAITVTGGCSIAGNTVTMTSGTTNCTVQYNQAGNGSYSAAPEVTNSVTATKKSLTITANSSSKTYGDTKTFLGTEFTTSALVAGDSVTSTTIASTGAAASAGVAGSPYTITISDASGTGLSNYNITYNSGVLTVNKAQLTVTADNLSRAYGDANPTLTASITGFVNGQTLGTSDVTGTPSLSTTADTTTDVSASPVAITVSAGTLASTNYSFTFANGQLTITPRSLTISMTADDKVYDQTTNASIGLSDDRINADVFTTNNTGFGFSDENVGLNKTVTITGLSITGGDSANYSLTSTSAIAFADITPATLTVTASGINKVYDGTIAASVSLNDDRYAGDDVATGYTLATFADANVGAGKTVTVVGISITGGTDAGNYVVFSPMATTTADITIASSVTSTVIDTPTPNSTVGTSVLLNATVTGPNPTGTVSFYSGATLLGSATVSNGSGSYSHIFTQAGSYDLTAQYSGDVNHSGSTSGSIEVHIVDKDDADTVTTISSSGSSLVGASVDFTATVDGSYNPTGTVEFYSNNILIGTGSLNGSFQATLNHTFTLAGDYDITAHYLGDSNNNPSQSIISVEIVLDQEVRKDTPDTSTVLSVANPSTIGDTVVMSATVSGGYNPTGVVFFKDGGLFIGSGALVAGTATFSTDQLAVGSHNLTAEYQGDVNNNASTSAVVTVQVVQQMTSVTILGNIPTPLFAPASITFNVTVNGYFPTGTVTIKDGPSTVTNVNLSNGSGSFTQVFTGAQHIYDFTAEYPGDINNTASVSPVVQVLVAAPSQQSNNGEQGAGADRGQNTGRANSIARFAANIHLGNLAPGAFGGADAPLAGAEKEYICSIQRSLPRLYTSAFLNALAEIVSRYTGRSADVIAGWLGDLSVCADITEARLGTQAVAQAELTPFYVNSQGFPISKNPTWNKCVTGKFTYEDIQSNPDRDRKGTPKSCADYHTGSSWYHPDLNIFFDWNLATKKLTLPSGYVIQKDEAVSIR